MQSKQMRKHWYSCMLACWITICGCCIVSNSLVAEKTSLDFINNDLPKKVYASELTTYVDADNNITKENTVKTNAFEEAQDLAISKEDTKNELEIAIMRKQNTQPVMTAAYTKLDQTASKGAIDEEKAAELKRRQEEAEKAYQASLKQDPNVSFDYTKDANAPQSSHITELGGIYEGPSGHETYYNLPMDGVISIMRQLGYSEEEGWVYWVRDDGAKMFGNYVMVAANLKVRPRGSLVECSLGTAIVCDTGDFAKSNAYQLDIAVTW